jgi:PAS domain S-box-containing protein
MEGPKDIRTLCRRLPSISAGVTQTVGLARLLAEELRAIDGVTRVGVYLHEPAAGGLRLLTSRGFKADERSAAAGGEVDPLVEEQRGAPGIRRVVEPADSPRRVGSRPCRARVIVPLTRRDELVGVLDLGTRQDRHLEAMDHDSLAQLGELAGMCFQELAQARQLRRQEIELRSITCSATDAIILADGQGRVTFWNWAAENLFGYSQGEVLGGDLHRLLAPDDYLESHVEGMRHFQRTGEGLKIGTIVEMIARRKDGMEIPVEISVTAVDGEGGPLVVGIVRDISERWQTEQELRASERRYRAIVEDQTELICRYKPDGTMTFVNDAYCRYFGMSREALLAQPFSPEIPEADRQKMDEQIASLGADQPMAKVEHRVLLPGGQVRWQQWTDRAVFDGSGAVVEYQAVGRDITEQRRAEEALLRAHEELERRVEERTAELSMANRQLVRQVAERHRAERALIKHQAQLRSMSSQLSLAEERERRRIATAVHDDIGQCLALSRMKVAALTARAPDHGELLGEVAELLDGAIHNTRTLTFELSTPILYDLGFVAAVEWACELVEQQHGISFVLEASHDPLELDTDVRVLLFRAVRELLHNMVKHAQASKVWIDIRLSAGRIDLTVEDDGVGFPEPPPDVSSGAGFGLFAIRERVTALGGSFEIAKRPGGGARIIQSVPLDSALSSQGDSP